MSYYYNVPITYSVKNTTRWYRIIKMIQYLLLKKPAPEKTNKNTLPLFRKVICENTTIARRNADARK